MLSATARDCAAHRRDTQAETADVAFSTAMALRERDLDRAGGNWRDHIGL
jgi:hypothetical protein